MSRSTRKSPSRVAPLTSLALAFTLLSPSGIAAASHIGASSLTLSDTAVGATATYTLAYKVGSGNGSLVAGEPTLRVTLPSDTDISGVGFDAAESGICACSSGTVVGTYDPFPAFASGGGFTFDSTTRTVTIGPLDVATVAGETAFRIVLTGIINRTTEGSTSLTAQVTNASGSVNTSGTVSYTLTGASAATGVADPVGSTTATLSGSATAPAGVDVTRRGVVLAVASAPLPEVDDAGNRTINATSGGTGAFQVNVSGLAPEETYRFRAFIITVGGVQYGLPQTFVTAAVPPVSQQSGVDEFPVSIAVEQSAGLSGLNSLLVRENAVAPTTTTASRGLHAGDGVIIEDEELTLRVSISATGGVSATSGIIVEPDGEVVCEICAQLASGSVVEAWIYSAPRLAAAVLVEADAPDGVCPLLRIPIGALLDGAGALESGAHTLQLRMYTEAGFEVLAVPITVGGPVPAEIPAGDGAVLLGVPLGTALPSATLLAVVVGLSVLARSRRRRGPFEEAISSQ